MSCQMSKIGSVLLLALVMLFALHWQAADLMAGKSVKSQSGRFDPNDIDCNNLDQLTPHLRAMAERRCRNKKANFTVANKESIDNEPMPADLYKGDDKSDYIAMIQDVWKARYPEDSILGIRFLKNKWKREKDRDTEDNRVLINDFSVLEVAVVVLTDPEIATIFQAFLKRDNQTGEIFVGVDTKKPNYTVRQMKVKNWVP